MSGIIGSRLNVRGSGLVSKLGTDGQVLTSAGAGQPPAFEDAAGGGKILQVVSGVATSAQEITSTTFVDVTDVTADITPAATSSKVLVIVCSQFSTPESTYQGSYTLLRDAVDLGDSTGGIGGMNCGPGDNRYSGNMGFTIVDSPSSVSTLTYKLQAKKQTGGTSFNVNAQDVPSTIVLMEIGA